MTVSMARTSLPSIDSELFYIQESQEIVQKASAKIQQVSHKEEAITALFNDLFKEFGTKRQDIELKTDPMNAKGFGKGRFDDDVVDFGEEMHTPLADKKYQSLNESLLDLFSKKLSGQRVEPDNPARTKFNKKDYGYPKSQFSLEVREGTLPESITKTLTEYNQEHVSKKLSSNLKRFHADWLKNNPEKGLDLNLSICFKTMTKNNPSIEKKALQRLKPLYQQMVNKNLDLENLLQNNADCCKKFVEVINKAYSTDLEEILKDHKEQIIPFLCDRIKGNLKSAYIVGTAKLNIDGELVTIAQYLTWIYRDYTIDPLERMKKCSTVWISHMPYYLLPKMMKDITQIFCKAIVCTNLEELKQYMGEFRFKFAFACPFKRGSASIAEWFEKSIYLSKEYELTYKESVMLDLKAFELPLLPTFLKNYPNYIELKQRGALHTKT